MDAATELPPRRGIPGVTLIRLGDGRAMHIDDIRSAAEGQAILDEIDGAIFNIETQVSLYDGSDPDWRRRAGEALNKKRRIRPRLQARIAELRRSERAIPAGQSKARPIVDRKRIAFINAVEEALSQEQFERFWERAAEIDPDAFDPAVPASLSSERRGT